MGAAYDLDNDVDLDLYRQQCKHDLICLSVAPIPVKFKSLSEKTQRRRDKILLLWCQGGGLHKTE
jgi:hypothetical protein